MTDLRQAANLALEALVKLTGELHRYYSSPTDMQILLNHKVITALKAALAQPEQEPVGSLSVRYHRGSKSMTNFDFDYNGDLPEGDYELYTTPPAAQRPWQGLTDEEVAIASAEFDLKSKMAYRAGMYKAQIILRKKNDSTY
jgi:hypothetical protein